jgi:hypothetical protein
MPHYKDGSPAREGDIVKGIPYNTNGKEVVGVIIAINPEIETCNCQVIFPKLVQMEESWMGDVVKLFVRGDGIRQGVALRSDYGEVKAFEKIL